MAWQGCFSQLGPEGPGLKSERRQDVHATSPYGPRDFGIRNLTQVRQNLKILK